MPYNPVLEKTQIGKPVFHTETVNYGCSQKLVDAYNTIQVKQDSLGVVNARSSQSQVNQGVVRANNRKESARTDGLAPKECISKDNQFSNIPSPNNPLLRPEQTEMHLKYQAINEELVKRDPLGAVREYSVLT